MIVHNVTSKHNNWIGPWEVAPLDYGVLTDADIGRDVIYRAHNTAEHGIITSYRDGRIWARFHKGDTAAACDPRDLVFAVREMGYAGSKAVPHEESDNLRD